MKIFIFSVYLCLSSLGFANAQEIFGTVLDEKKETIVNASVQVFSNGILKGGAVTDFDGHYAVKPLDTGYYDVKFSYVGMNPKTFTKVVVTKGEKTELDAVLEPSGRKLKEVIIYKKPLVDKYKNNTVLTSKEISSKPTTLPDGFRGGLTPGIYQQQRGAALSTAGGRTTGNVYIIDGVQVQHAQVDQAQGATSQPKLSSRKERRQLRKAQRDRFVPDVPEYKKVPENDFMLVKASPVSTMSVDVDRASYSNIRRYITNGQVPPPDAIRIEEMVNYFDYNYPKPNGADPIAITTDLTTCPWNEKHQLLKVGIRAKKPETNDLPAMNLVFLIDVSGSMETPDRLPLLKESLRLLVPNLRAIDKVAMVAYAGNAGLVLRSTSGDNKLTIIDAIDRLEAGGSTAGGAGIELAYKVAQENFVTGGNNRVFLATDGDFNVGVSSDNELEAMITKKRSTGIFLTCLGFGDDNYKDARMEMLADKGNGNYDYIDNIKEAEKTLVKEFKSTLFTVAKDVKAQIEFNPQKVQSYRLIGYENRMLNTEDFRDDKKDAGDMGAGHTVTILYELVPVGTANDAERPANDLKYQVNVATQTAYGNETATIKFRYKAPDGNVSQEITHPITEQINAFSNSSEDTRFAAATALFGMLLKESQYAGTGTFQNAIEIAQNAKGTDPNGYRAEMIELVKTIKANKEKTTVK